MREVVMSVYEYAKTRDVDHPSVAKMAKRRGIGRMALSNSGRLSGMLTQEEVDIRQDEGG